MRRLRWPLAGSVWRATAAAGVLAGAGCGSSVTSPDLSLTALSPQVVCATQSARTVKISGDGMTPLTVDSLVAGTHLQLPRITLSQAQTSSGTPGKRTDIVLFDGADPAGTSHVNWLNAQGMTFEIYPGMVVSDTTTGAAGGDIDFGLYDVRVQNPDRREATLASALAIVQPPSITQVAPSPSCNAQGSVSYTISGRHFLQYNADLPTVTLVSTAGNGLPVNSSAAGVSDCTPLAAPAGITLQDCSTLTVSLPQGTLLPDDYQVTVTNPGPSRCSSVEDVNLPSSDRTVVIPPPTLTSVGTMAVCALGDTTLQLTGTNFLLLGNPAVGPTVTINGQVLTTTVDAATCTPVHPTDAPNAQLCTALSFTVPTGTVAQGSYSATITNPGPNACSVTGALQLDVVGMPTLDAAKAPPNPNPNPTSMCTGGGNLSVTGQNIYSGAAMTVNGFGSTSVSVTPTGAGVPQTATGNFGGPIPITMGTLADITVQNVPGVAACTATLPRVETITPGPSVLFVDPPVIPRVVTMQATIYATGVSAPIKAIRIYPSGSMTPILTYNAGSTPPLVVDAALANRAYVTINANTLPAGTYDVGLDDQSTCAAFLPGAFKVVATPTLTVTSMTPAFGSTAQNSASVIAGSGFVSVPRAYLSPASGTGTAQALSAVTFGSATSLNSVVRSGLTPQAYDLVVVNPSGTFGIAKNAFTVTSMTSPPPTITSIAPASLVQATATAVVLNGSGFRTGGSATLTCYNAANSVVAGSTATVTSVGGTGLTANVTLTAPNGSTYCIVRFTNQDGTFFDYSAVGVTGSSLNLTGFKSGTPLTTPRRALAAVAGRPTSVARFVYAIGGDSGADNAPKASVEAASTGLDGTLGSFAVLSQSLPKALSFIGASVIGRFIYSVGGFDGTAATKAVYRAEILSPLNAPQLSDANYLYDNTTGLAGGVYFYRISAVLSAADASNPNGETLAGDYFPIQVPVLGKGFVQVQLFWPSVTGAASYKVYRTLAGGAAGSEKLLATVTHNGAMATQTYTDNGGTIPTGAGPLPVGSTGAWASLPQLGTARIGAGVAAAQDPSNGNVWYLYAAGGNSGTLAAPTSLSSVEFLPITVTNSGSVQTQAVTTWTAATSALSAARWTAAALPATAANNNKISGNATYLYVAGGSTTSLTSFNNTVEVALVNAGGQLAAFTDTGSKNMPRPGYGGALVNNQMMAFGGFQAGAATTASVTAQLTTATMLSNFNALGGGTLLQNRALQGTALESAFIYQLGGANAGPNSAQNTTEQTIW